MRSVARVLLLLLALPCAALGAEKFDVDGAFEEARRLGFSGKRERARKLCTRILEHSPGYHDVRVFRGRLHAWDKQYERARRDLRHVLAERPEHHDARKGLIDVELWSDHPAEAIRLCDEGLELQPGDEELQLKKAKALAKLGRPGEGLAIARKLSRHDSDARHLAEQLILVSPGYQASVTASYESFDDGRAPWRDLALQVNRRFRFGSLIGRVNLADRFHESAEQYEIDAYPKLAEGMYLYLNGGYSSSGLFPDWRFGGEVYRSLPFHLELAAGLRYLDFRSSQVTLYTGYLGRYKGDYFIWLRPYLSNKTAGTSASGTLFVRRYLDDEETYLTFSAGAGSSPDADLVTEELTRLDSWKIGIDGQKRLRGTWVVKAKAGYRSQEFRAGRAVGSWTIGIGVEKFF